MRAAAIQIRSGTDRDLNLEAAERLVRAAAAGGADLIALPEKWVMLAEGPALIEAAEPLEGPTVGLVRSWAEDLGVALLAGSLPEPSPDGKAFNTSVLISAAGEILAAYRKLHLFDVDVGGRRYRESDAERAGEEIVVADLDGDRRLKLGMAICYDLRFPELFRAMADRGADVIAVPSAFTSVTGRDHWEPLVRARAIENQAFVLAPGQIGEFEPGHGTHGHSMIVDPWGKVLDCAPEGEGFAAAELDLDRLEQVRDSLPALRHRRPELFAGPGSPDPEGRT